MNTTMERRRCLRWLLAGQMLPLLTAQAQAQAPSGDTQPPRIEGRLVDGQRVRLADFRGRVVLVFHWSTRCAVCMDKMAEFRANLSGWTGRPFAVLGVNHDPRLQDLQAYERLVEQTVPAAQRFVSMWAGSPGWTDTTGHPGALPYTLLINAQGMVVERYAGRVPPQAWDRIAERL